MTAPRLDEGRGVWLASAWLCGCGFVYEGQECPKCRSNEGINLGKLLSRLTERRKP